jgi:predicted dehydrogenase
MKIYVLVGVGGRSVMYEQLTSYSKNSGKLVAICDRNAGRLKIAENELRLAIPDIKSYLHTDFEKMLAVHKPDTVIVCSIDSTHHDYICRSLYAGCDVITEKPMTIDIQSCQNIVDAVKKTGKKVRVTFNYRYAPPRSQVKELLNSGVIGKILSVEFQYLLDTNHGADYFRRWHRNKLNSGGLLVHKATHHFDLVNWLIGSIPATVVAMGGRVFYNQQQANRYGLEKHSDRCLTCKLAKKCNYFLDMKAYPTMKELYLDNESYDGYYRDLCVFSNEINIEDSMNVIVQYGSGVFLSYSLNAFSPWEGYRLAINGTKGRLEHTCQESSYVNSGGSLPGVLKPEGTTINIFPHFKSSYNVPIRTGVGAHGGGDVEMLHDIFGDAKPDPLSRSADYVQGAYSILVGIAANKSIASNQIIRINDLVQGLPLSVFDPVPGEREYIPYVPNARWVVGGQENVLAANLPTKLSEMPDLVQSKTHNCVPLQ